MHAVVVVLRAYYLLPIILHTVLSFFFVQFSPLNRALAIVQDAGNVPFTLDIRKQKEPREQNNSEQTRKKKAKKYSAETKRRVNYDYALEYQWMLQRRWSYYKQIHKSHDMICDLKTHYTLISIEMRRRCCGSCSSVSCAHLSQYYFICLFLFRSKTVYEIGCDILWSCVWRVAVLSISLYLRFLLPFSLIFYVCCFILVRSKCVFRVPWAILHSIPYTLLHGHRIEVMLWIFSHPDNTRPFIFSIVEIFVALDISNPIRSV